MDLQKPNKAELEFLHLAYDRFFEIFEEVMGDPFWSQDDYCRFAKATNGFFIYTELLNYEPIKHAIKTIKANRPPMEGEIASDLFKFIRNLVSHFPVFKRWDDVWCSETLVNWERKGTIDKFLRAYSGKPSTKYRLWDPRKKEFTFVSIDFPQTYGGDAKIFLKEIVSEIEGLRFSFALMNQVLQTQVELH